MSYYLPYSVFLKVNNLLCCQQCMGITVLLHFYVLWVLSMKNSFANILGEKLYLCWLRSIYLSISACLIIYIYISTPLELFIW